MAGHGKWLTLLTLAVAAFYWRILFTGQFSVTEDWEAANQGYAWHQFAARAIQEGILPLWNPYTFSGRSHIGEMQPGLFYPLKLPLYLWPLGQDGLLSDRLLNAYYAFSHWLAAVFMYFFAIEAGVRNRLAAMIAGLCFALGGFVGNVWGHQLWDSALWLPLVLLLVFRALRADSGQRAVLYSALAGLALSMTLLAGGMHAAVMDTIVIVSAACYWSVRPWDAGPVSARTGRAGRAVVVILTVGVVTFAAAGIQFLPSLEYAPYVYRWGSGGTALQKIRYKLLTENYYEPPRALFGFLFGAAGVSPAEISTYIGVLPFLLAILGAWQYGRRSLVKYLGGLGVLALVYSLGPYSLLHGVLYVLPLLDKLREPGRFIYLTHFAIAILAGYGAQGLLEPEAAFHRRLRWLCRALGTGVLVVLVGLGIPAVYDQPPVYEWHYFSLLMLAGSWALLAYFSAGRRSAAAAALLVGFVLWDLYSFNWIIRNRAWEARSDNDHYENLVEAKPLADFFHSQPGMFRVQIEGERPLHLNLGDMYAVQTTGGQAATTMIDYVEVWGGSVHGPCLVNLRYRVAPDREMEGRLVFQSGRWRVYEQPKSCPRAWIVHQAVVEPSEKRVRRRMKEPWFDPLQSAFVKEPLGVELEPAGTQPETVAYTLYQPNRLEAEVQAAARGLVVFSEIHYPGWIATVNGQPVPIHKVDSLLRGVVVEAGRSRVVMVYRPRSVLQGALLSGLAFAGTFAFAGWVWWRQRGSAPR
ncbi:MAG TPA: YfhO family protein [Terriglobia bacterium]|nr:YfhO family protein [Terriglobia bacterium]